MTPLDRIRDQVTSNNVVLYMKGTPQFPQCGFSSRAAQVLQACGVKDFLAVNVLADPEIFENLKYYANWPTFPQLYVKGELIGGSDIMIELAAPAPQRASVRQRWDSCGWCDTASA